MKVGSAPSSSETSSWTRPRPSRPTPSASSSPARRSVSAVELAEAPVDPYLRQAERVGGVAQGDPAVGVGHLLADRTQREQRAVVIDAEQPLRQLVAHDVADRTEIGQHTLQMAGELVRIAALLEGVPDALQRLLAGARHPRPQLNGDVGELLRRLHVRLQTEMQVRHPGHRRFDCLSDRRGGCDPAARARLPRWKCGCSMKKRPTRSGRSVRPSSARLEHSSSRAFSIPPQARTKQRARTANRPPASVATLTRSTTEPPAGRWKPITLL